MNKSGYNEELAVSEIKPKQEITSYQNKNKKLADERLQKLEA